MTTLSTALIFAVPLALIVGGIAYAPRKTATAISTLPQRATPAIKIALGPALVEWEHGWKTDRVIATRYNSPMMGWNIGFTFPLNPNDCDRAELSDFMEAHNGRSFQSGGFPGAEMFVKFKDITDKESATAKIKAILPELSALITRLSNGEKVTIEKTAPKYTWPDTSPIDKSDPYWKFNNNLDSNGTQYMKAEVSPGKWQWVVDQAAMDSVAQMETHRRELFHALTTRVMTDDELKEAASYGASLNIEMGVSYYADQKQQELSRAFTVQQMLRTSTPTK